MRKIGKLRFEHAQKDKHMEHFTVALQNALDQWNEGEPDQITVTLEGEVGKNPGGIKEYRAIITG
ncbi:MAG: hypothetical protein ACJ74L_07050 [Gaiellaceae bacterium]